MWAVTQRHCKLPTACRTRSMPPPPLVKRQVVPPSVSSSRPVTEGVPQCQKGVCTRQAIAMKRADTVGQPPSTEIGVPNMPSLKAKKLRKLPREKVLLEL